MDDLRSLARLGNNSARFGTRGRRSDGNRRNRGGGMRNCWRRNRHGSPGCMRQTGLLFLFLLLGQDGLQHIAWFGDVGEVDFGRNALCVACGSRASMGCGGIVAVEMNAHLLRFVCLERARVGLAGGQTEFRQNVKNLFALDFHLACEIVDTNLTHPPLFELLRPKPVRCSSLPLGCGVQSTCSECRCDREGGAYYAPSSGVSCSSSFSLSISS